MSSPNVEKCLYRAMEHMEKAEQTSDESQKRRYIRQAMAECGLALKEANGFFPKAHVLLGVADSDLNDRDRAFAEWDLATQQDPYNFASSGLRLMYYLDDYRRAWRFYNENTHGGHTEAHLIKKYMIPAAETLQQELEHFLNCWIKDFNEKDIDLLISETETVLELASDFESADDIPIGVAKSRDIYWAVFQAPWSTILSRAKDREEEIESLRRRAEGLYEVRQALPPQKTLADLRGKANAETAKAVGKVAGVIMWDMTKGFIKAVFK